MNRDALAALHAAMLRCPPLVAAAVWLLGCGGPPSPSRPAAPADTVVARSYHLSRPDTVVALPAALREISGLTVLPSGRLAAVQDERGVVYELDAATGAVLAETRFHGDGDFEGVEWAGDALWVLQSNGDLFRLAVGAPVARIETPLASRNDTEGIAWDPARRRLLIVAKEHPGGDLRGVRAIYAFDPATGRLSDAPVVLLDRGQLDTPTAAFKPSALAVHPTTGELYVLSSVRRALAVVAPDGTLLAVADFPADLMPQPEGLAFAPDGTLYVASEGGAGRAVLARYTSVASSASPDARPTP